MKLRIFNGAGSLIRNSVIKLLQLSPVYCLLFIAYGDRFLPAPAGDWSYNIRTTINNVLIGSFEQGLEDKIENSKFKENRLEKITNEVDK
jgi:hypothetical protein